MAKDFHFDHIEIYNNSNLKSHFFTYPNQNATNENPRIFGIFIFESYIGKDKVENILNQLTQLYYNEYKNYSPEKRFEQTIKQLNLKITEILETVGPNIDWHNVKSLIGTLREKDNDKISIFLTSTGNLQISAFHNMGDDYKVLDIITPNKYTDNIVSPLKMFSDIIYGDLNINDFLFITTDDLLNYVSIEKIKDIANINPYRIREEIQKIPTQGDNLFISSTILKLKKEQQPLHTQTNYLPNLEIINEFNQRNEKPPTESIETLNNTEKTTTKIMEPNIIKNNFSLNLKKFLKKSSIFLNQISKQLNKNSKIYTKKLYKEYKKLYIKIKKYTREFLNYSKEIINNIDTQKIQQNIDNIKNFFIRKWKAIITVITIIIVSAFLLSFSIRYSINKSKISQQFNNQKTRITNLLEKAEGRIIAKDNNTALLYIKEAEKNLQNIPKSFTKKQKEALLAFYTTINKYKKEIQKIKTIENYKKLIKIKYEDGQIINSYQFNKKIYTITNKKIIKIDTSKRGTPEFKQDIIINKNTGLPKLTTINDDRDKIIVLTNKNKVVIISDKEQPKITDAKITHTTISIGYYNNSLYSLGSAKKQIYRHRFKNNQYSEGLKWFRDSSEHLIAPKHITIDGNIFILDNLSVLKYKKGKREIFSLPPIEPNLKTLDFIYTNSYINYIALLDKTSQRIILIDKKTQKLLTQFVIPKIKNITAFDIANNKIFLSTDNSIYSFDINI